MGWLVSDGHVIASLEIPEDRRARRRGLLGRDGIEGAIVIEGRSIHTFGMRFAIDAAMLDDDGTVLAITTVRPSRVTRPRRGVRRIVEARAGAFDRWGVRVGDQLELRD